MTIAAVKRLAHVDLAYPPSDRDTAEGRDFGLPNPRQRVFHSLPHLQKMILGGVGGGKSAALIYEMLMLGYYNPGATGILTAPKQAFVESAMTVAESFAAASYARDGIRIIDRIKTSQPLPRIDLPGGGRILCVSGYNPEALMAHNAAFIGIDELEWFKALEAMPVLRYSLTRRRQRPDPALKRWVRRRAVVVATTARFNTGAVKWIVDQANNPPQSWQSRWAVVKCPSRFAVGFGIDQQYFDDLRTQFDSDTYDRMVECKLGAPPGAVYAHLVDAARYPAGNVVDLGASGWIPELPVIIGVDWGTRYPHFVAIQHDDKQDVDYVIAEWGENGADVQATIQQLQAFCRKHHIAGFPGRGDGSRVSFPAAVWSDPADKPGAGRLEFNQYAESGNKMLRSMGWPVYSQTGSDHSVEWGVSLVAGRLKRADGLRRIVFSSRLTTGRRNVWSETIRPLWKSLTEGYRRKTHPISGEVLDEIDHDREHSHAADAFRYAILGANPHERLRIQQYLSMS